MITSILNNRPEHSELTNFMSHKGSLSSVVGMSVPIKVKTSYSSKSYKCVKNISSCTRCVKSRIKFIKEEEFDKAAVSKDNCRHCYDWDLSLVEYYHKDDSSKKKKCKEITFSTLQKACEETYWGTFNKSKTKEQLEKYWSEECLVAKVGNKFYKKGKEDRDKENSAVLGGAFPSDLLPACLSICPIEMSRFMVGIMHTLILNNGKHILNAISVLMSDVKKWAPFFKETNVLLTKICTQSCSFCKAWPYGSHQKPGSVWVSDNYLAYIFVIKSLNSMVPKYLDIHTSKIVMKAVCSYSAFFAIVFQPRHPTLNDVQQAEAQIKMFLNNFNELDELIKCSSDETRKIESTACFINSLLVPRQMEKFGMLRNLYEGKIYGEGAFLPIKKLVKRGMSKDGVAGKTLRKSYHTKALEGLEKEVEDMEKCDGEVLQYITDGQEIEEDNESKVVNEDCAYSVDVINGNSQLNNGDPTSEGETSVVDEEDDASYENMFSRRYRKFYCWKTYTILKENIEDFSPICLMFHEDTKSFYAAAHFGNDMMMCPVEVVDGGKNIYNTWCFEVELQSEESAKPVSYFESFPKGCVACWMFPMNIYDREKKLVKVYYYSKDENHLEYCEKGKFVLPKAYC